MTLCIQHFGKIVYNSEVEKVKKILLFILRDLLSFQSRGGAGGHAYIINAASFFNILFHIFLQVMYNVHDTCNCRL